MRWTRQLVHHGGQAIDVSVETSEPADCGQSLLGGGAAFPESDPLRIKPAGSRGGQVVGGEADQVAGRPSGIGVGCGVGDRSRLKRLMELLIGLYS